MADIPTISAADFEMLSKLLENISSSSTNGKPGCLRRRRRSNNSWIGT